MKLWQRILKYYWKDDIFSIIYIIYNKLLHSIRFNGGRELNNKTFSRIKIHF